MARTLDPEAAAEKDKQATAPAVCLRLDLPSPAGTRYYSDRSLSVPGLDIDPRIVEAGRISRDLAAGKRWSLHQGLLCTEYRRSIPARCVSVGLE